MSSLWPEHSGPTAEACIAVCDALAQVHGRPSHQRDKPREGCEIHVPHTVLDSLVRTILSQNTTDITSQRAFSSLKAAFADWEQVRTAPPGAVEKAIRVGGLADIKAARIKTILNSLLEEQGTLSLEHLRDLPVEEIKAHLSNYKGVGPKTIACVLMFCLGRPEFPVDVHVWEISKQLGWVPAKATREQTYQYLNQIVPNNIKYDLHVLMVQHGKVCPVCSKRGAAQKRTSAGSESCCLAALKPSKSGVNHVDDTASKASSSDGDSKKRYEAGVAATAVDGGKAAEAAATAAVVVAGAGSCDQRSKHAAAAAAAATRSTGRLPNKRSRQQEQEQHDLKKLPSSLTTTKESVVKEVCAEQQAHHEASMAAAVVKQEDVKQAAPVKKEL